LSSQLHQRRVNGVDRAARVAQSREDAASRNEAAAIIEILYPLTGEAAAQLGREVNVDHPSGGGGVFWSGNLWALVWGGIL
jgi:hypothetical protein